MILLANAAFDEMLLLRSFPLFRSCESDLLRNAAKANTIDASLILLSLGQYFRVPICRRIHSGESLRYMMKDTIKLSMVWKTGDSCRMYGDICRLRGSHREAAKTFDCLNVALRTHCFMLNAIFRTLDLRLVPMSGHQRSIISTSHCKLVEIIYPTEKA
ncbi:unnamed protein product [Albugo candida]|uniref:Uncharacterized protein n=1 Tax=Albugo candida TaxID=65357 RepID=A0A024GIE3_9STRA|nr:unnamed protein product [Albugo candida]|eukprot:CCI46456.1 unnamed protein product [Albugo candida]